MAKTKTRKKTSPVNLDDLTLVAGQNEIAYGPQFNQIRDAARQVEDQYRSDVAGAKGNALSATVAARQAQPDIRNIFDQARADTDATQATAGGAMRDVGVGADVFRNAMAREQEAARNRVTTGRTGALTELTNRIVSSEAGKQLALGQASRTRAKGRETLNQRLSDVLREQGAATNVALTTLKTGRDAATAKALTESEKAQAKQDEADQKTAEKEQKRVTGVRGFSGDYVNKIADAVSDWDRISRAKVKVKKWQDVVDKNTGKVTGKEQVLTGETRAPTADEIRKLMGEIRDANGHAKYQPGDVHVALLRRVGKPLDAAGLQYLRSMKNMRIPRDWLQPRPRVGAAPLAPSGPGSREMRPT